MLVQQIPYIEQEVLRLLLLLLWLLLRRIRKDARYKAYRGIVTKQPHAPLPRVDQRRSDYRHDLLEIFVQWLRRIPPHRVPQTLETPVHARLRAADQALQARCIYQKESSCEVYAADKATIRIAWVTPNNKAVDKIEMFEECCRAQMFLGLRFARCDHLSQVDKLLLFLWGKP